MEDNKVKKTNQKNNIRKTKNKKKTAFTLIELLAVIVILGVLALITVPIVSNYISDSRQKTYTAHETTMAEAAKSYTVECINGAEECTLPQEGQ